MHDSDATPTFIGPPSLILCMHALGRHRILIYTRPPVLEAACYVFYVPTVRRRHTSKSLPDSEVYPYSEQ
jgi:hypothetical protein